MFAQILLHSIAKFDPDQLRQPKGSPHGGEFAKRGEADRVGEAMAATIRELSPNQIPILEPGQYIKAPSSLYSHAVRGRMKAKVHKDLTERLKDHPAFAGMGDGVVADWVKNRIDLWATTSGDSSRDAIGMQRAVQAEFELKDAATNHFANSNAAAQEPISEQEMARNRAFVRAEYERTQEWFTANGITHVSVMRGIDNSHTRLKEGHSDVTMQPASSWTTNVDMALSFANSWVRDDAPAVITSRVPISSVLSTAVTGRGSLAEHEVILLGRPQGVNTHNIDFNADSRAEIRKRILSGMA